MEQNGKTCCVCGASVGNGTTRIQTFDNKFYCKKHYLQMYRHGHILERTIFDPNEYKVYDDYAECICYGKDGQETGRTKIDINKIEILKNYKIYIRKQGGDKLYAAISIDGKKVLLHRFLYHIDKEEYSIRRVIDHINGDSLDNRMANLRLCSHKDNMKNIHTKLGRTGVQYVKANDKWGARITHNYKSIYIGNYDTYEEALLARIREEYYLFKDYGPNKDLFYVLDLPSPLEELHKVVTQEGA